MKFALKTITVLVVVVVVAFTSAAIVIPRKKTFVQETEINASREVVWQVLNDKEKYPEWQEQIKKVAIRDEDNWSEETADGQTIVFKRTFSEEPAGMGLEYSVGDYFRGTWRGELRRLSNDRTIIRTTDSSEVDSVVMKVFMAMFFDIEDFARDWNKKLKKRAESLQKS